MNQSRGVPKRRRVVWGAPCHLLRVWRQIETRIRQAGRVALFLDFDGTLAPIAPRPDQVRLPSRARDQLQLLAQEDLTLGVVSGRQLTDLTAQVALGEISYVGAHGYFVRRPGKPSLTVLDSGQQAEMARVHRRLTRELRGLPGVLLEWKQATVAVHYRQASKKSSHQAFAAVCKLLEDRPYLHLLPGKKVWELFPNSQINKWSGIQHLLGLDHPKGKNHRLIFYVGDDTSDEEVFSRMEGVSVVVGRRRHTAAQFFLESPSEVVKFLGRFREAMDHEMTRQRQ